MNIFSFAGRIVPAACALSLFNAGSAFAASGSGTENALVVTGILTLLVVALTFFALVIPDEDLRAIGSAARRAKTYLIPDSTERVPMFDHEFDGIRELDNRIPPWFTTLFSITVAFAAIYLVEYHLVGSSKLSADEYREEMLAADLQRRIVMATEGNIDESQLVALKDPLAIQRGGKEFGKYCVSCHGQNAGGLVGPNLTDDYWIHGGGIRNVYNTIKQGVPAKGMISWQLVFAQKQLQEIASYVLSLRGTNPPGGRKPEGQLYIEKDTTAAAQGLRSDPARAGK